MSSVAGGQHIDGLRHINVENGDVFSALLVVNTPVFDDSGVSHAVEHFVFRRSHAFKQTTSLFQITALTDVKINASTLTDKTYFHCHSRCYRSFSVALSYLLNGILLPDFVDEDMPLEISNGDNCGVIFRELTASALCPNKVNQLQADVSDQSPLRRHQYSGIGPMFKQLSCADLCRYHRQFYHPENIDLITTNTNSELVQTILSEIKNQAKTVMPIKRYNGPYRAKPPLNITAFEQNKWLLRYWLDSRFFSFITQNHKNIAALLKPLNIDFLVPENHLNQDSKFALDIIIEGQDHRGADLTFNKSVLASYRQYLINKTAENPSAKVKNSHYHQAKYPAEINFLLGIYHQLLETNTTADILPLAITLGSPKVHRLADLQTVFPHATEVSNHMALSKHWLKTHCQREPTSDSAKQRLNHDLIPQLVELSSMVDGITNSVVTANSEHLPKIPNLLIGLYKKARTELNANKSEVITAVIDKEHCLISAKSEPQVQPLMIISSYILSAYPTFLLPRTQGLCYLITALYCQDDNSLIIFSALDVTPKMRVREIAKSLQLLSQDSAFIEASLILAKTKYSRQYQVEPNVLAEIATSSIAKYLYALSVELKQVLRGCI
mgnify:CR=1 FL=1